MIDEADARVMVRLVADVSSINTTHYAAKNHPMNGLIKMVGADCWVWALASGQDPNGTLRALMLQPPV